MKWKKQKESKSNSLPHDICIPTVSLGIILSLDQFNYSPVQLTVE